MNKKKNGKERREEYRRVIEKAKRGGPLMPLRQGYLLSKHQHKKSNTDSQEPTEEKIPLFEDIPSSPNGEKQKKSFPLLLWVCGLIILLSMILALCLTAASVAISKSSIKTPNQAENTSSTANTADSKVVYIRDYDSSSGILAPEELYESCKTYTVSVIAIDADGREALSSGFVFHSEGYIATAAHGIIGAEQLKVITSDGEEAKGELISANTLVDLALIKIKATSLPSVVFGSSRELLAGERIYAIGTPSSAMLTETLYTGNITYVNRVVDFFEGGLLSKRMKLLQTDLPLSQGCAGCPVFDCYGRLIGIGAMQPTDTEGQISFALPADGALSILTAMKDKRDIDTTLLSCLATLPPRLGIVGEPTLSGEIYGYRISGFTDNTSSASLFLQIGDIITEIDGIPTRTQKEINSVIEKKEPRDRVSITVLRAGQMLSFEIILGE